MPEYLGLNLVMWILAFIFPIILYFIIFNLYVYNFIVIIHKYMSEMRYELMSEIEKAVRTGNSDKEIHDISYDQELITAISNAPIWPIGIWKLRLLYLVGTIPVVLSLPTLIGWSRFLDIIGNLPFI